MKSVMNYLRRRDGSGAVEFALILPLLLLFVFGVIEFGVMFYTSTQLNWAAEEAARCASVKLNCKTGNAVGGAVTNATVKTYANSVYRGLAPATFTYINTGTCSQTAGSANGKAVGATATHKVNLGVYFKTLTLKANACFP